MTKFDKKIKNMSKEFKVPETYHEKVDGILEGIREDSIAVPRKKPFVKVIIAMAALVILLTGGVCFSGEGVAEASFFENFKHVIMDFIGMGEEQAKQMGVGSEKIDAVGKPDLMLELKEVVMDTQNIYAVVKITAPSNVVFKEGVTFDYFGFCEGTNYNESSLVPGSRECTFIENLNGKKNVGMFVVSVGTDEQIAEGKDVAVFFENLIAEPYKGKPDILVEGIWSLSFNAFYTNTKNITVKGTKDMKYSFAGAVADIKKVKLLPLGLTLVSDVSRVDMDTLNTTDTRFGIRLKMIDGSEIVVDSPKEGEDILVGGGSVGQYEKKGRVYQKYVGQFRKAIDISKVMGIYISDFYLPLKEYD